MSQFGKKDNDSSSRVPPRPEAGREDVAPEKGWFEASNSMPASARANALSKLSEDMIHRTSAGAEASLKIRIMMLRAIYW